MHIDCCNFSTLPRMTHLQLTRVYMTSCFVQTPVCWCIYKALDVVLGCAEAYMVVEDAKSEVVKSIEEVHTLFKDDLSQGQVPRLPCNKEIPHGPFQVWYDKVDEVIQVPTQSLFVQSPISYMTWNALICLGKLVRLSPLIKVSDPSAYMNCVSIFVHVC